MTIIQLIDGTLMYVLALQCFWLGTTTSSCHSCALRLVLLCIPLTVMSWLAADDPVGARVTYWSDVVTHVSFIIVVCVVQHLVAHQVQPPPRSKPKPPVHHHAH